MAMTVKPKGDPFILSTESILFYLQYLGSLQLLLSLKTDLTTSLPQIFLPARFGFSKKAALRSEKYLLTASLHSSTDW
jgi:hypothetical protein